MPKKYQDKPTAIPTGLKIDLPIEHAIVSEGDTLWSISQKTGVPLKQLLQRVPESVRKDPRKLQPGMMINLEGVGKQPAKEAAPASVTEASPGSPEFTAANEAKQRRDMGTLSQSEMSRRQLMT